MLPSLLAIFAAVALAWWSWRGRLDRPAARWAALCRAVAIGSLLLLLLDPGIGAHRAGTRPLVLLDHSISMHAAGSRRDDAVRAAAAIGDTVAFGELTAAEAGGVSQLLQPLTSAVATGRPVAVVSDGEIDDAASIPPALLSQVGVRIFPRAPGADQAITSVTGPTRLAAGDTLAFDIDAARTANAPDSMAIDVGDSSTVLLHAMVRFGRALEVRAHLAGALPKQVKGERWLRIFRNGAADGEPADDARLWRLIVTPAPGVVVLAEIPDWDARALYRTLADVVETPVRGYVQLRPGEWHRMDDLRRVPASEVSAAARSADLVAVRGHAAEWQRAGHARLLWQPSDQAGDWYVAPGGASPVGAAFAGVEPDSLPAVVSTRLAPGGDVGGWVGAVARRARRGSAVPIITGHEDPTGRTVTISADGLYRWPLRGGAAEQVWRSTIADAANWLLGARRGDSARARPVTAVTQRGRAVRFRWTGSGPVVPLPIELDGPSSRVADTLRFGGDSDAALALGVGRYRYQIDGGRGGGGTFAVEPYSDEFVPAPITLHVQAGAPLHATPRRPLRELLWLFGAAIAGFGLEWMLRRRLGLR